MDLLRQPTTMCVINSMKQVFARFGIPRKVVSDNGPQYNNTRTVFSTTHELKHFAEQWGFQHVTSSPGYPQSNGCVERAVQTAKQIFRKATAEGKDPFEGLLKYRNTPFEDIGASPTNSTSDGKANSYNIAHTSPPAHITCYGTKDCCQSIEQSTESCISNLQQTKQAFTPIRGWRSCQNIQR